MSLAIGIDLGTSTTCAAIVVDGKPTMIKLDGVSTHMSSVYALKDGNILIGKEAQKHAVLNPTHAVSGSKRLLGRSVGELDAGRARRMFGDNLRRGREAEVVVQMGDKVITPVDISAAILSAVKDQAAEALGKPVDMAVITVPAYFNARQRNSVREAGERAGLRVLRLLPEPTAAAMAYGTEKKLDKPLAVFDLGGGTFDVSIINVRGNVIEVVATGGDNNLGGVDFDDRVVAFVLDHCRSRMRLDPSGDATSMQRIREASEQAKIALSSTPVTTIRLPYLTGKGASPGNCELDMTRFILENMTGELVDRAVTTCANVIREAGMKGTKIDELLLVGGQARMPLVQKMVTKALGYAPSKGISPDEAVAMGAALLAHSLSTPGAESVVLLDVLPQAIGIAMPDGNVKVLFQRHQPLPDYYDLKLSTSVADQDLIQIRMVQGDDARAAANTMLGLVRIPVYRKGPAGSVTLHTKFMVDTDGILTVKATDPVTGQVSETNFRVQKSRPRGLRG